MPSASSISLADGTSTARSFDPQSITPASSTLVYRGGTSSAGNTQLILELSPANANRPTNRVKIRVNKPVEQTVDSVTTVAYTARFVGEFVLPEEMTSGELDDILAFAKNAMANSVIGGYVTDQDPLY